MIKYPLSNAQKRIWYAQKKYGASSVFNIGGRVFIKGNVNLDLLARSFQIFVEQNDALHIRLYEENGEVFQIDNKDFERIDMKDFSGFEDAAQRCEDWCQKKAEEAFAMIGTPLYYFCVFKLTKELTGYFVKFHHIIADGWSMELLTKQIAENYEHLFAQKTLDAVRPSYLEYAAQEAITSWEKEETFWLENAALLPDINIPNNDHLEGKRQSFILDNALQKRISSFIKQKRITWNVFFIGIFQIYQYKKFGQKYSLTGIPFLGRTGRQERMMFGTFTNTLPFCSRLEANETIDNHYAMLSKQLKRAYKNQCYPVNLLAQKIQIGEREGQLYHTCINYYNTTLTRTLGGFNLENSEFYRGCQEQPLQVIIRHWDGNKAQLDFDYQIALYSDRQIQDMYEQWILLIEQIIADPSKQISELCLVSDENQRKIINMAVNKIKEPAVSWVQRLNDWVLNTPDVVAVSQDERSWTYAQFYDELSQLITYYKASGIQKGDIVMAALPHEMKSVVVIFSIILCGAIYLPVSLEWPIERIKEIQQDCQARFLVSDSINLSDIRTLPLQYKSKERTLRTRFAIPDGEDVAYIIYTSGSTGKPKGVMICHRSLNCYLQWASDTYSKTQNEVHALFSDFPFDFTITSLFVPIMTGGEIRIYTSTTEQPNVFGDILNENRVTVLKITPSHIGLIQSIEHQNRSIHTFVVGGEDLKTQSCQTLLEKFMAAPRIFNEYGPTEATVGCIIHKYDPQTDKDVSVPIGKPIAGAQALLLDQDGNLLPYDTKAELILGGEGVTCGYCGNSGSPDKFIQSALLPGETLYRTGDLAYINEQGIYMYCGRIDDELKIRGYRINLTELEHKAMESEMILEAAAKAVTIQGSTNLFLYVVGADCYQEKQFSDWLTQRLPGYMLPRGIVKLDAFPLTAHGKVDKSKLPEWKSAQGNSSSLAKTAEEELLFHICNDLLPNGGDISAESNFYALGGDSIKAIQISSRILEHGYELKVSDILTNPIFREMAKCINKRQGSSEVEMISEESFEGLPIIQWFFNQGFAEPGQYNQSVVLRIKHTIDKNRLEKALSIMIAHHDSLRINVAKARNQLFYNPIHLDHPVRITEIETTTHGWTNIKSEIQDTIYARFDIEKDLLFRTYLIHTKEEQYLFFIFHHLIIDGVSWQIFLHDLSLLLDESEASAEQNLPPKTISYARFAHEYKERFCKKIFNSTTAIRYEDTISKIQQKMNKYENNIVVKKILSRELSHDLIGPANITYNTKPYELIIIALALTVQHFTKKNKVEIALESHGRDSLPDIDVRRTIGWFTTIYPVVLRIKNDELEKQIIDIKEQLRQFDKNKHIGSNEFTHSRDKSNPQIRFNYMGDFVETNNHHWILTSHEWSNEISPSNQSLYSLDAQLFLLQDFLHITIAYSQEWRKQGEKFFTHWIKTLELIIEHCMKTEERVLTPSDFEMVDLSQDDIDELLKQL